MTDTANSSFIPLSLVLDDIGALPADIVEVDGGGSTLDKIGVRDTGVTETAYQTTCNFTLVYSEEILFALPGLSDAYIVFGGGGGSSELQVEFDLQDPPELRLPEIDIALRFSSDVLKPVTLVDGKYEADDSIDYIEIGIEGAVTVSKEVITVENTNDLIIDPFMISDTGVVIDAGTIALDLSQTVSMIPEAEAAGLAASWMGVYIESASIYLPDELGGIVPSGINIENCFIGSGGFTGEVSALWTPELSSDGTGFVGSGAGDIFGLSIALKEVSIALRQNSFEEAKVEGVIILPFFDQPILCEIGLCNDGDFTLAISAEQQLPAQVDTPDIEDGLFVFTKDDLLKLKLQSIAFVKKDDLLSIDLSGSITPLFLAPDIVWPEFEVKKLSIDSNGKVSVEGGWMEMSGQQALDFNGFKVEITRLGFGNEDDGSRWIGLSGGIQLVDGLPLKGGVEGLKLIWGSGGIDLQISGINVAFEIENTIKFDGRVYFIDEPTNKGFKGGIKVTLPPLSGLMLDGQFMTGRVTDPPAYNYAYIYLGVELPAGIPLGSTGASLYGLAGLVGYNATMDKRDTEAWYENDDGSDGFYKRGTPGITTVDKWTNGRDARAFGAGVTIGTTVDDGFTFTGKVLVVVLLPGPVIVIEGKANFLKERSSISEDAIFTLLAVLDPAAGTYLFNVGASYRLDAEKGSVITLSGTAEAFFNANDPSAWHFYIGKDTPESKRIQATIISLFQATSYFMVDKDGLILGGKAGYEKTWKFSVLKVVLQAYIEGRLEFSIKPIHAKAEVLLVGNVELSACGVGIGLSVSAYLMVQTPDPWHILGEFNVKLNLPWPLPDPEATVTLEWKEESEPPIPLPLATIGIEHHKTTEKWELETYPEYDTDDDGYKDSSSISEPSNACSSSPYVPPDGKPVITFSKPVNDAYIIGSNPSSYPGNENVGDYEYGYELKKITLEMKEKSGSASWTMVAEKGEGVTASSDDDDAEITGYWQAVEGEDAACLKLMLWVNTPYELTRELESNAGIVHGMLPVWLNYPCSEVESIEKEYINFDDIRVGTRFWHYLLHHGLIFESEYLPMDIVKAPGSWAGVKSGLTLGVADLKGYADTGIEGYSSESVAGYTLDEYEPNKLTVIFPEDISELELYLSIGSEGQYVLLDDEAGIVGEESFNINARKPLILKLDGGFRAVIIKGHFILLKIGYITQEAEEIAGFNQGVSEAFTESLNETWSHSDDMLEPDKYFKVTVHSVTKRRKNGGSWGETEFVEHAYFQTGNPPGAFSDPPEDTKDVYPYGGMLMDLTPYVETTIPAQVASNEKIYPAYRAYDVGVIFNEAQGYVEQMYLMATLELKIKLFDNNGDPVLDTEGNEVEFDNAWADNPTQTLTRTETQWLSTLDESNCSITTDSISTENTTTLSAGMDGQTLNPQTLYKARLMAGDYDVYRFSFITSRYCSFLHHLHSFIDMAWSHHALIGSPDNELLDTDGITDIEAVLSGFTKRINHAPDNYDAETEAVTYEQLANIFSLQNRQLPERVEVTILNDTDGYYGLLLESPEPMLWERITVALKYRNSPDMLNEASENLKALDLVFGSGVDGEFNTEYLDVLVREACDIGDYTLELENPGEESNIYHTFNTDNIPAGRVLRVYSGEEEKVELPSGYTAVFAGDEDDAFNYADGVIITLRDASGEVLHSRLFDDSTTFASKNSILVRNEDQTKALFFIPASGSLYTGLNDGLYRMSFNFQRDIGIDYPLLKMAGDDGDEDSFIEFDLPAKLPDATG